MAAMVTVMESGKRHSSATPTCLDVLYSHVTRVPPTSFESPTLLHSRRAGVQRARLNGSSNNSEKQLNSIVLRTINNNVQVRSGKWRDSGSDFLRDEVGRRKAIATKIEKNYILLIFYYVILNLSSYR